MHRRREGGLSLEISTSEVRCASGAISAILCNGAFVLGHDLTHAATGWTAVAHTNITIAQALPAERLVAVETFASPWVNLFAAVCRELLWRRKFAAVGKECGAASDGAQHHQRPWILILLHPSIGETITRETGAAQTGSA